MVVLKQLRASPLIQKQIFVSIVVVVSPNRAHGNAGAGLIDVGNAQFSGDIFKGAIAEIAIKSILAAFATVGYIDVRPAIAIEVNNGYSRAHGCNLGHHVVQFVVEGGPLM